MKVVLIEDDKRIADRIKFLLDGENILVTHFDTIENTLTSDYLINNDLIILDLMLPGGKSGDYFVDLIRKNSDIPILIISALYNSSIKVKLFAKGIDDYLVKPFNDRELIARVKALHRRSYEHIHLYDNFHASIKFFRTENKILREGNEILLTNKESLLLNFLLKNNGKILKSENIIHEIWKNKNGYHANILQTTIRRLRKKIDDDFSHKLIKSIYGVGYSICLPS